MKKLRIIFTKLGKYYVKNPSKVPEMPNTKIVKDNNIHYFLIISWIYVEKVRKTIYSEYATTSSLSILYGV